MKALNKIIYFDKTCLRMLNIVDSTVISKELDEFHLALVLFIKKIVDYSN